MNCDSLVGVIVLLFALAITFIFVHFFVLEPRRIDREYEERLKEIERRYK